MFLIKRFFLYFSYKMFLYRGFLMWKRLNSNQMCEQFSYKEVFLINRFLIERFYCIYIYIQNIIINPKFIYYSQYIHNDTHFSQIYFLSVVLILIF